jgi:PTH1 family peptidyl-tRNA hydrolase
VPGPIQLIVGLGNPGPDYDPTRHNAGFWFADLAAQGHHGVFRHEAKFYGDLCKVQVEGCNCWLLKPSTFMNRSGQAVAAVATYYKIPADQILVAHDELDLPPGIARLKQGGGHGGHNGLRSVIASLADKQFQRLRLGVGHPGHRDQVVDYVLHKPSKSDRQLIDDSIDKALQVLPLIIKGEMQRAMNKLHSAA